MVVVLRYDLENSCFVGLDIGIISDSFSLREWVTTTFELRVGGGFPTSSATLRTHIGEE